MSKSVSNDALWEKLLEMEEKIEKSLIEQNAIVPVQNQAGAPPELEVYRDEILVKIEEKYHLLGTHSQSHFEANKRNLDVLEENIRKVLNVVRHIRKQQKETVEQLSGIDPEQRLKVLETQEKDDQEYFNLRFFKVRKSSLLITILGLLVFILMLFCMKQQNDYSLLNSEYYRQRGVLKEVQVEVDSLKVSKPSTQKRK